MASNGTRVGTYLLWLVLAVSAPLLAFSVTAVWQVHNAQRQQREKALIDQAREVSATIGRTFDHLQDGLLSLSESTSLANRDFDSFGREMRLLSTRSGNLPIVLTNASGAALLPVNMSADVAARLEPLLRQAAQNATAAGGPRVSNLLMEGDGSDRHVTVAVPVPNQGASPSALVVVALLGSAELTALADVPRSKFDGLIFTVRDRTGVTVSRSLQSDPRIGEPANTGFQPAIRNRSAGILPEEAAVEGIPRIQAFSIMPITGYSLVAALPHAVFDAAIYRDLLALVSSGAVLLCAGMLGAVLLSRHLVGALRLVGRGDASAGASGLREVDELAVQLRSIAKQRDETECTLRGSEARLRELIGTLDLAAIMEREFDGTIRFWSHGCVALYGWSREEAVGRSSHDLLRTQFPVSLQQIEQSLLARGEWNGDLIHRRRDGTTIVAAAHKALKRDLDGNPQTVMESLVDVTALREAQQSLHLLNQGLEDRVRAEVAAREAAQTRAAHADRIQALGQLAGGIAHDFNNVLQAVAGGATLIGRRPHDAIAVSRLVRVIGDAATRGASITRRMLLLARRGDLKAEPVDVQRLLTGMREVFIFTLGAMIEIDVEVAADLPRIMADKAQMETALVNLATNARDAMPDGGRLRLTAGLDVVEAGQESHRAGLGPGVFVRLSVIDDGTGMTSKTLARAAEPFFTTKDVGRGTGLGLSMVKGFAEQSGGGFEITSEIGKGTHATIWMPGVSDPAKDGIYDNGLAVAVPPRGRILLVDDDQLVRDTLAEQLEALGHKVLAASGGTDALCILRAREAIDLMITDLSMPGMSGLTLIKEAHGLRPSLPAILLTGFAGDTASLEQADIAAGSYLLMRKPTTSATLGARVTALLERHA